MGSILATFKQGSITQGIEPYNACVYKPTQLSSAEVWFVFLRCFLQYIWFCTKVVRTALGKWWPCSRFLTSSVDALGDIPCASGNQQESIIPLKTEVTLSLRISDDSVVMRLPLWERYNDCTRVDKCLILDLKIWSSIESGNLCCPCVLAVASKCDTSDTRFK